MTNSNVRRKFLKSAFGSSAVLGIDAIAPKCLLRSALGNRPRTSERVLVVIQLSGGNDGLNTIVPIHDDAYYAARPKLAIARTEALQVDKDLAFHPSMRAVAALSEQGRFSVIHGVGYENPNRSHFESMDIWHSCKPKTESRDSGWLGRFLDANQRSSGGDMPAFHLGENKLPLALAARNTRVPSVRSLDDFRLKAMSTEKLRQLAASGFDESRAPTAPAVASSDDLLAFVQSNTVSALEASQRVADATKVGETSTKYPESQLAERLSVIAQLIDAELATQIYYVELDGFDTHAQQPDAHASLLGEWSSALGAFIQDLDERGNMGRTCVLTFSEFGRRVAENASEGTDHGAAAPVYLSGGRLASQVVGTQPSLTDLHDGDLKYAIDFRRIYASLLKQHLGWDNPTSVVGDFRPLSLFQ